MNLCSDEATRKYRIAVGAAAKAAGLAGGSAGCEQHAARQPAQHSLEASSGYWQAGAS